jgi:hypothetical protein
LDEEKKDKVSKNEGCKKETKKQEGALLMRNPHHLLIFIMQCSFSIDEGEGDRGGTITKNRNRQHPNSWRATP